MARGKPTPDERIGELEAEEIRLAVERDGAQRALQQAKAVLALDGELSVHTRQRAALQAQARGRQHELLEVIAKDGADAQAALQANAARTDALSGAMAEVSAEIQAIRDSNLEFFARDAHAASLAADEVLDQARAAIVAAHQAWQEAQARWGRIRASRRRLGWEIGPEFPLSDLSSLLSGFEVARRPPWPGGRPARAGQAVGAAVAPGEWPSRYEEGGR
jgi:hypothetical protein